MPTTRSSVAETGRFTNEVVRTCDGIFLFPANRSLHSVHQVLGLSGSQPKRQSSTTLTLGRSAASERDAVDFLRDDVIAGFGVFYDFDFRAEFARFLRDNCADAVYGGFIVRRGFGFDEQFEKG